MAEQELFDTIVVGSGFGGSVATYRIASAYEQAGAGQQVCLLERGKAYAPGEFPRTPWAFSTNFWNPEGGHHGLFDIWSFTGCEAVVSAGLGGGSLIYSNALVRPPQSWLKGWPIDTRVLEPHFANVEQMLGANPFPFGEPGYGRVAKSGAMQEAAQWLHKANDFEFVNLAVSFRDEQGAARARIPLQANGSNYHDKSRFDRVERTTCTLCCQCNIGCNTGSKNTLDHTYLSAAPRKNVEIRTRAEVKEIVPCADGYEVRYLQHTEGVKSPAGDSGLSRLTRRRLILSAGTFGTTYLLLKNSVRKRPFARPNLPNLSRVLGQRFSTNGDYLMWFKNARTPAGEPLHLYPSTGLPVTMAIKYHDFYIEDAGYPFLVDWLLAAKSGLILRALRFVLTFLWAAITRNATGQLGRRLAVVIGSGDAEATSMPLGAMGLDNPSGKMTLGRPYRFLFFKRHKRLQVDWEAKDSADYFERVERAMKGIGTALRGQVEPGALSRLSRTITVHPLGGCPMGESKDNGVCDQYGEVFGYDNLFIADGSVMPAPIGANPSLTIAAFSDRMATAILTGQTRRP